ncbi:hypothetical protein KSS87_015453 [Heliosperma pusillum]|nr:hypothetical protein KSS87_015453 [Heliosperma pusillum]
MWKTQVRRVGVLLLGGSGSSIITSSSSSTITITSKWCDSLFASPSSSRFLFQRRGAKVLGSDVLKAQHTQHGRGGATIQVELRDVDTGNKLTERFRTDEPIEKVYVEEKTFKYLYSEGDILVLTESVTPPCTQSFSLFFRLITHLFFFLAISPQTYEQVQVPKDLFGKSAAYLKEDMTVRVHYFDDRPMSATLPYRVTCTVIQAQPPKKGLSVNPQYKKVLLDNGLTVLAPPFIVTGDRIVINTDDDSYFTRRPVMTAVQISDGGFSGDLIAEKHFWKSRVAAINFSYSFFPFPPNFLTFVGKLE